MRSGIRRPVWRRVVVVIWMTLAVFRSIARSQDRPPVILPTPATPSTTAPPPLPQAGPITVEQLAERLRAMEDTNRKLADELERSKREHDAQIREILERFGDQTDGRTTRPGLGGDALEDATVPTGDPPTADVSPVPDYTEGQFAPFTPAPGFAPPTGRPGSSSGRLPLLGSFGPGFQFQTENREFQLQIHYESQIEGRVWGRSDQDPNNSGIFLPRQRIFFSGHLTRQVEYELAINRGSGGTVNVLNAFINLHLDDRFQVRFGRFFTPLPYDQYAISNYWLPTPERSLFTTNLSLNRQFGLMGWGYLFDKQVDYAAGIFNGSRNSFESLANGVDFVGYLNARPFQQTDALPFARFLNVGTSVAVGHQDQQAVPMSFRLGGGSPNGDIPGAGTTPFLILNRDVVERGQRVLGSTHAAYFYKSLSLIGEWQYGYGGYASAANPSSTRVPFSGFYLTGAYFLTGEQIEQRARVRPLRPFIPLESGGIRGPGAWEAVARVSRLSLGREIFNAGFADPNLWSNSAVTTELGANWYWNEYIKIYMFWLHGQFGDPVQYRAGHLQESADMFWLRFQLYF
ncbi:porin [Isosphaeraceae bacterium EP7]